MNYSSVKVNVGEIRENSFFVMLVNGG